MLKNKALFSQINEQATYQTRLEVENFKKANGLDESMTVAEARQHIQEGVEYMTGLFTGKNTEGQSVNYARIPMKEAFGYDDAGIILRKAVRAVLQQPVTPNLFLTNNVATVLPMGEDDPVNIKFASLSAIEAAIMARGGEYPVANLAFTENEVSMSIRKIGVMIPLEDEIMRQSIYPLLALSLQEGRRAVEVKTESMLYNVLIGNASVTFDNTSTNALYHTSGKDSSQVKNGTYSYMDLVKQCGKLIANKYNATHVLTHPLAWAVFAMDPFMQATFMHQGQIGGSIWSRAPQFDQNGVVPFGIQHVPYYATPYEENATLAGPLSGAPAGVISDIYVIDAANSMYLATQGDIFVDSMEDWYKDLSVVKVRRYADAASKDGGKAMSVAKNVRVDRNFDPIMTIATVT